MKKRPVYLDYSASTPLDPKVVRAMLPYLKKEYGNPSSMHALGQRAKAAVEQAREETAAFLSCSANEVVFASGATEANNLVIQGIIGACARSDLAHSRVPHVIVSAVEHESVLVPVQELERQGMIEATYISPDKEGLVRAEDVRKSLKENTALVSIQYANSEIGTIQPIAEIGNIIRERNKSLVISHKSSVIFHTDAVQAANYLACDVSKLKVDLLTLSSHKLYGPKGVGALYVRAGVELVPLIIGGGQEQGLRSGTENVAGIVGFAAALREVQNPKVRIRHITIRQMRDKFLKNIKRRIPGVEATGSLEHRLPHNIHLRFPGLRGKDLVQLLDQKGIALSTGSACSERSQEPSHVLLAMGYSAKEALSSLRITLGKYTTPAELQKAEKALVGAVEELRKRT